MNILYLFTIYPIEVIYKHIYLFLADFIGSYGIALFFLSLVNFIICVPLRSFVTKIQKRESTLQSVLAPQLAKIKAESSGAEKQRRIHNLYKRYSYHPILAIRSVVGLFVQLPFLIAAFYMLSDLDAIKNVSFLFIKDLSQPDALLFGINILPFLMTGINIATAVTMKDFSKQNLRQSLVLAVFFLVLLYNAPSALLIFWTVNNLIGLVRNFLPQRNKSYFLYSYISKVKLVRYIGGWSEVLSVFVFIVLAILAPTCKLVYFNLDYFKISLLEMVVGVFISSLVIFPIVLILEFVFKIFFRIKGFSFLVFIASFLTSFLIDPQLSAVDGKDADFVVSTVATKSFLIIFVISVFCSILNKFQIKWYNKSFSSIKSLSVIFVTLFVGIVFCTMLSRDFVSKRFFTGIGKELSQERITLGDKNIFVFSFDQVQSDLVKGYLENNKSNIWDGFTLYTDATSVYPNTNYSLASVFYGKVPEDSGENYSNSLKSDLPSILVENGFDVKITKSSLFPVGEVKTKYAIIDVFNLIRYSFNVACGIDILHFSYLNNLFPEVGNSHIMWKDDIRYFVNLSSRLGGEQNHKNVFIHNHFLFSHQPFSHNLDFSMKKSADIRNSQNVQGAIETFRIIEHLCDSFFEKLKRIDMYDNSMIFVISDHGYEGNISSFSNKQKYPQYFNNYSWVLGDKRNFKAKGAYNPIIFFKDFDSEGSLKFDKSPRSLIDIAPTITKSFNINYSWDGFSLEEEIPLDRLREFLIYIGGYDRYDGDRDKFHDGLQFWEKRNFKGASEPNLAISMNLSAPIIEGLSGVEAWGQWSDGKSVRLVQSSLPKDLTLSLDVVHLFAENSKLPFTVRIGEQEKQISIPGKGQYSISFEGVNSSDTIEIIVPKPQSPLELGLSGDSRKLGIGFAKDGIKIVENRI